MDIKQISHWVKSLKVPYCETNVQHWSEICDEARPCIVASCYLNNIFDINQIMLIVQNYEKAIQWSAKLHICGIPQSQIKVLQNSLSSLYDDEPQEKELLAERFGVMLDLCQQKDVIVIATPDAALEKTIAVNDFVNKILHLSVGMEFTPTFIIDSLTSLGYELQEPVRQPGTFSNRGGIIDVFPAGAPAPVRIEFFGDVIESLRHFDVDTQKSVLGLTNVIIPVTQLQMPSNAEGFLSKVLALSNRQSHNAIRDRIQLDVESFKANLISNRILHYLPEIITGSYSIIDYVNGSLFIDEPSEVESEFYRIIKDFDSMLDSRYKRYEIAKRSSEHYINDLKSIGGSKKIVTMSSFHSSCNWVPCGKSITFNIVPVSTYFMRRDTISDLFSKWYRSRFNLVCSTDQPLRAQETLSNYAGVYLDNQVTGKKSALQIYSGNLSGGFIWEAERMVLITDREFFGTSKIKIPQKRFREGVPLSTIYDLKVNDYVVHIHFGIGIYKGMVKRNVDGILKEFLQIEYAYPDKLLVPTDQLDRIQKYLTTSDNQPKLYRITGSEWKKTLRIAKKGAEEFARSLLEIYAKRSLVTRLPYGSDTPWQAEMEATFPYSETVSQLNAIQDIKNDLNFSHPMDRLICGDVGFGKTEIAIRAAFKVIQAGKQVVVLCPTTILAEQHYVTFKERLAGYPVNIQTLSRLKKPKQRAEVINGIKDGTIDIVIGTHALLQKEIDYKDLGLVVIDEEQRFGVKHKEMLKQIRSSVDVLTLTATPIPRTFQMALMNVRAMSIIADPPPGRLPVRTYIKPYNDEIIKEALLREITRGGQVIYVYNKVDKIGYVAENIKLLLPNARIAIGHGQMSAYEIESVMRAFFNHEIDILVCTTIVENGIDNPNANTLIVDGADKLGLSQLYQLRGRVGRSDRQAYSYFIYRTDKKLTHNAIERLKALQEFATLGSGYSLAFRDLQIRGAGEILGTKQHGMIQTVGFELFMQLINNAVTKLRKIFDEGGEQTARFTNIDPSAEIYQSLPTFELPVSAYLPNDYITDESQRLYYYKKLMEARDIQSIKNIQFELLDRYGTLPAPAEFVITIMGLRIAADQVGINKIEVRHGKIIVDFRKDVHIPINALHVIQKRARDFKIRLHRVEWQHHQDILNEIREFLEYLQDLTHGDSAAQVVH